MTEGPRSRRVQRAWVLVLAPVGLVVGLIVGLGLLGPSAAAHNVLLSSDPEDGATLDAVPSEVELVFDQVVQQEFSQVAVIGPDGADWASGGPAIVNGTVTVALRPLEQPGAYTIGYRIVSADGHPVSGEIGFVLVAGATGLAPPTASVTTAPTSGATTESGASDDAGAGSQEPTFWVIALVAAAGCALVVGVALLASRRRSSVGDGHRDAG